MKSLKELYEKPYSLMLQFQSADFITASADGADSLGDGDGEDVSDMGW